MKPFRIPLESKKKYRTCLKRKKDKIIQPSQSPYASSLFLILKCNGYIRLVVDYRKINKITLDYCYIFHKIMDLFVLIKGSNIFSKLYLNSGYNQVEMDQKV
ncbi:Transposon Ty3-G Gag-Pol polyprotein [Dictyocoela muelleri]|nr:Transposon Ty3-G Gag-Pol polyprotein [Dictyocoela muelleri]